MKFEVELSDDGTHVRIRVFTPITEELTREFTAAAIGLANQHGILKYLVDVRRAKNISSTISQYQMGYEDLAKVSFSRKSMIAVVYRAGDTSHNFVETVMANAGFNCKLFEEDDAAALKWLHRKPAV